jgi:NDP-sugar pyrophosphorylase family protein
MVPIAMILAAGVGSRLQPLTDSTPKALLPFRGRTMLEQVLLNLKKHGIEQVVINIHHHADQVENYVRSHDYFGMKIVFSDERDRLMDTGGGILKARQYLEGYGPFLVHNVDIFSDLDLTALYDSHIRSGPLATLAVQRRKSSRNLLIAEDGRLAGWRDRSSGKTIMAGEGPYREKVKATGTTAVAGPVKREEELDPVAFSGIHIIDPKIFTLLDDDEPFSIMHAYLSLCDVQTVNTYDHSSGVWIDMAKKENFPGLNE